MGFFSFSRALVGLVLGTALSLASGSRTSDSSANSPRTPVLVELFTSEGCSSCPPADAFLTRLEALQPVAGAEIIAIEEHVDYWDELGWRDPFSSADWTERQRRYAGVLGNGNVYTPQMVINGSVEFVGSKQQTGADAIQQAARQAPTLLTVSAEPLADKRAAVNVTVQVGNTSQSESAEKFASETDVWLAITESGLQNSVKGGENAGKDLRHASVLRKLQKIGAIPAHSNPDASRSKFAAKIALDSSWKRENLHVVAFLQEKRKLHILGAAQIPLNR